MAAPHRFFHTKTQIVLEDDQEFKQYLKQQEN